MAKAVAGAPKDQRRCEAFNRETTSLRRHNGGLMTPGGPGLSGESANLNNFKLKPTTPSPTRTRSPLADSAESATPQAAAACGSVAVLERAWPSSIRQFSHTPLPPDWQVSIPLTQLRFLRILEMLRARPESERACGLWRKRQTKKLSERQTPPPFLS